MNIKSLGKALAYAAFITVPATSTDALTAQLSNQISDPGTFAVIVLVIGIPLTFYVIRKLISLFPKK